MINYKLKLKGEKLYSSLLENAKLLKKLFCDMI